MVFSRKSALLAPTGISDRAMEVMMLPGQSDEPWRTGVSGDLEYSGMERPVKREAANEENGADESGDLSGGKLPGHQPG